MTDGAAADRSRPSDDFSALPVYAAIAIFAFSLLVLLGIDRLVWPYDEPGPMSEALAGLLFYLILPAFLWFGLRVFGAPRRFSIGVRPSGWQVRVYLLLGVPLIGISVAGLYAVYLPISYVKPEITAWMLDSPTIIWWRADFDAVLASCVNAFVVVVLGPILEEVLFRGFLLNRIWTKLGPGWATFISSLLFAALHVDPIGAFIFGIIAALIYMRTGSLAGPILIHIANNGLLVLAFVAEGLLFGDIAVWDVAQFRSYWWWAPIGGAIGIPWLIWFYRRLNGPEFAPREAVR